MTNQTIPKSKPFLEKIGKTNLKSGHAINPRTKIPILHVQLCDRIRNFSYVPIVTRNSKQSYLTIRI